MLDLYPVLIKYYIKVVFVQTKSKNTIEIELNGAIMYKEVVIIWSVLNSVYNKI